MSRRFSAPISRNKSNTLGVSGSCVKANPSSVLRSLRCVNYNKQALVTQCYGLDNGAEVVKEVPVSDVNEINNLPRRLLS